MLSPLVSLLLLAHSAPDPTSALAKDIARCVLAHDESIRSLHWHQHCEQRVKIAGANAERSSEQGTDELGRWFCVYDHRSYSGKERGWEQTAGHIIYDGVSMENLGHTHKRATIDEYRGDRSGHESVECWLGREVDSGKRRLGEVLLGAPDLTVTGYSERSLPVLGATANVRGFVALIEVEVDVEHGFAPCTITLRDRALRVPYFCYRTISYVAVNDIWLPETASLEAKKFAPTQEDATRLFEELSRRHLSQSSDFLDPEIQSSYAAALSLVFGTSEAPSALLVEPIRVTFSYDCVNCKEDPSAFSISTPKDYQVVDFVNGRVKLTGKTDWVDIRNVSAAELKR